MGRAGSSCDGRGWGRDGAGGDAGVGTVEGVWAGPEAVVGAGVRAGRGSGQCRAVGGGGYWGGAGMRLEWIYTS